MENSTILFKEVQKFRQIWVWILVIIGFTFSTGLFGYAMIKQLILGQPFGTKPMSDTGLLIQGTLLSLFGIGLVWFFLKTKLITELREDALCLKFYPLQRKFLCFERPRIKSYRVRTYSAIKEYGGWGIRKGKNGFAYNISGNTGLEIELFEGTKIMIGTQKPHEFEQAMQVFMKR